MPRPRHRVKLTSRAELERSPSPTSELDVAVIPATASSDPYAVDTSDDDFGDLGVRLRDAIGGCDKQAGGGAAVAAPAVGSGSARGDEGKAKARTGETQAKGGAAVAALAPSGRTRADKRAADAAPPAHAAHKAGRTHAAVAAPPARAAGERDKAPAAVAAPPARAAHKAGRVRSAVAAPIARAAGETDKAHAAVAASPVFAATSKAKALAAAAARLLSPDSDDGEYTYSYSFSEDEGPAAKCSAVAEPARDKSPAVAELALDERPVEPVAEEWRGDIAVMACLGPGPCPNAAQLPWCGIGIALGRAGIPAGPLDFKQWPAPQAESYYFSETVAESCIPRVIAGPSVVTDVAWLSRLAWTTEGDDRETHGQPINSFNTVSISMHSRIVALSKLNVGLIVVSDPLGWGPTQCAEAVKQFASNDVQLVVMCCTRGGDENVWCDRGHGHATARRLAQAFWDDERYELKDITHVPALDVVRVFRLDPAHHAAVPTFMVKRWRGSAIAAIWIRGKPTVRSVAAKKARRGHQFRGRGSADAARSRGRGFAHADHHGRDRSRSGRGRGRTGGWR